VTKGLLVRLEARPGREDDVERFLVEARDLVECEPDTTASTSLRSMSGNRPWRGGR
jgi:hypothetical protein